MNEGEYSSLQTLLNSGSLFEPFRRPEGHSMNSLYATRLFRHARIGPKYLFPIL